MSLFVINYADDNFKVQQNYCTKTAYKKGKADRVIEYTPKDIDNEFFNKNKEILSQRRGGGYWLWKPYFINKTLNSIEENDYLMYCDSGVYYIDSIYKLIDEMNKNNDELMVFELPFMERKYTKRDAFVFMECNNAEYTETNQVLATYILMKNTPKVRGIMLEWLNYMQNDFIVDDRENILGQENYSDFIDHRHDQSILSLLTKKYDIIPYRDPSQYGILYDYINDHRNGKLRSYSNSSYPQILVSNRRIHPIKYKIIGKLRNIKRRIINKDKNHIKY